MTIISGHDLVHVLEALVVGMALKKTSTRRRICFVNDVPRQMELLLNIVWEIKNLTHLSRSAWVLGRIKAAVKNTF